MARASRDLNVSNYKEKEMKDNYDNTFFTVKFEYDGDKLIRYSLKEY